MNFVYSLTLYSLPFWSLPFLPGTYSALTPYLSAAVGVFSLFRFFFTKVIYKDVFNFTAFFLSLLILYSVYSISVYGFSTTIKIVSYLIGYLSIIGFYSIIKDNGLSYVKKKLVASSVFISSLAIVETTCLYLKMTSVKTALDVIFTGGSSNSLILTTSEPSWAVQLLLFCSAILLNDYFETGNRKRLFFIASNFIIFFVMFSLTGFFVLLFSVFLYFVVFSNISFTRFINIVICLCAVIALAWYSYVYGSEYFGGYTYGRIDKLASLFFSSASSIYYAIISIDNSLLVRVGYPTVAFNMMIDYPLGVGVGGFAHHLKDYLYLLYSPTFWDSEVPNHLQALNADTRNYFLTFGTDFGCIGLFFILAFHLHLIKKIKSVSKSYVFCAVLFSLSLGMMLQFSSQHFALYSFVYALILACSNDEEKYFNYHA